jgi:hypothetical protein
VEAVPGLEAENVTAVVGGMLGRPITLASWRVERVAYESGSPATGGLYRVRGTTGDGRGWSVFVKLLQHPRHWQRLHLIPPAIRESFAAEFPWRQELAAWEGGFANRLPDGLRLPKLYQITDLGEDRLLVWMEDINALDDAWDVARFARAAHLLGGLAALRSTPAILAATGYDPGWGLRGYFDGRVTMAGLAPLDNDDLWRHPLIAQSADPALRDDMRALASRLPAFLDRLDSLPQAVPHGDASPQNLLVPAEAPHELVAIDISFQCPLAIGFDLGQLLIGLVHAGLMPASDLPKVHEVLVPSFVDGAREYGLAVTADDVTFGYVASLVIRAGYTSLPYEMLGAPATPELEGYFRERAALTRFLIDLGRQL